MVSRPASRPRPRPAPLLAAAALLCLSACAHRAVRPGTVEEGLAGYYGARFEGKRTASGAVFHAGALTCAHRTLPFGTVLEVSRVGGPERVRVTVTDRGPYISGRIVDLSLAAARRLHMLAAGVARVRLKIVRLPRR